MFDKINKCNYKDTETAFSLDKVINNDMINRYNISMNCTYFITNCGQHPAAHWHFTYLEYKDLVLETANILKISEFLECSACVDIVCLWRCLNIFSFICLKLVNKWVFIVVGKIPIQHFSWLETNPFPLTDYVNVAQANDWRTIHRLSLFNDVANKIMSENKFHIIKTFNALLPFIDYSICKVECLCSLHILIVWCNRRFFSFFNEI